MRREYEDWLDSGNLPLTAARKIKKTSPSIVAFWVSNAWKQVSEGIVQKSFKKSCISNNLDGLEDNILWEENEEASASDSSSTDYSSTDDEKDYCP